MIYKATLKIQKNDHIDEVRIYSTSEEATPKGGSFIHVGVIEDGKTCNGYIGISKTQDTPLKVIKNNEEYYVSNINKVDVKIYPSNTYVIYFKYKGKTIRINKYTGVRTITCDVGEKYSISAEPISSDYEEGQFNIPKEGYVFPSMDEVKITNQIKQFNIRINKTSSAKITATYKGKEYTSDFSADIHSTVTFKMTLLNNFNTGTYTVDGVIYNHNTECNVIVEDDVITSVTSAEILNKYTVTLVKSEGIKNVTMYADGVEIQNYEFALDDFYINYTTEVLDGSELTVVAEAYDNYLEPTITFS